MAELMYDGRLKLFIQGIRAKYHLVEWNWILYFVNRTKIELSKSKAVSNL